MTSSRGSVLVAALVVALTGVGAAASPSGAPFGAPSQQVNADVPPADSAAQAGQPQSDSSARRAPHGQLRARGPAYRAAAQLPVRSWLAHSGYSRSQFGDGWTDIDSNNCDTRNDILRRDLSRRSMSGRCRVMSGRIRDPYTGELVFFVRGGASEIDIDHVVALSNAWSTGAARWKYAKRVAIANDPLNLLAVGSSVNRQKGDSDAGEWLPPARGYRCAYVARQVAVKRKYGLWVTRPERSAMLQVLSLCPSTALPGPGRSPVIAPGVGTMSGTQSQSATGNSSVGGGGPGLDVRYATCAAAKAAGLGPYVRGRDAEYSWYVDRDRDGIACER